jgi:hypothetical protein
VIQRIRVLRLRRSKYTRKRTLCAISFGMLTARSRLSREEREEAYKQARERIFGSTGPTEVSTPGSYPPTSRIFKSYSNIWSKTMMMALVSPVPAPSPERTSRILARAAGSVVMIRRVSTPGLSTRHTTAIPSSLPGCPRSTSLSGARSITVRSSSRIRAPCSLPMVLQQASRIRR